MYCYNFFGVWDHSCSVHVLFGEFYASEPLNETADASSLRPLDVAYSGTCPNPSGAIVSLEGDRLVLRF